MENSKKSSFWKEWKYFIIAMLLLLITATIALGVRENSEKTNQKKEEYSSENLIRFEN